MHKAQPQVKDLVFYVGHVLIRSENDKQVICTSAILLGMEIHISTPTPRIAIVCLVDFLHRPASRMYVCTLICAYVSEELFVELLPCLARSSSLARLN